MALSFFLQVLNREVQIRRIRKNDCVRIERFTCGSEEQDSFLKEKAISYHAAGLTTVYLVLLEDEILAYFTISPFTLNYKKLSDNIRKEIEDGLGTTVDVKRIPVLLLGQFAVEKKYQNRGVGSEILGKIIIPIAIAIAEQIGGIGLCVHTTPKLAENFYQRVHKQLGVGFYEISRKANENRSCLLYTSPSPRDRG